MIVDGRVVWARKGGLLKKLLRVPWPEADEIVTAVRGAIGQAAG